MIKYLLPILFCGPISSSEPQYRKKRPVSLDLSPKVDTKPVFAKYFLDYVFKIGDRHYAWDAFEQRYCELSDKTTWRPNR